MSDLTITQRRELAAAILKLPDMGSPARREQIVRDLNSAMADTISSDGAAKAHVLNIVGACAEYPGGLGELRDALEFHYRDTTTFHSVNALFDQYVLISADVSVAPVDCISVFSSEVRNNLPAYISSFIGREKGIDKGRSLLETSRLLTLIGAGGCGKTRLALQVAASISDEYPDGVWLVELAPISEPALVPQTIAGVLGVKELAGISIQQTLTEYLRAKRLLLVIDNCEHVIAARDYLAAMLRSCPTVKVLATSREALSVAGEQIYHVPSLSVPDPKRPSTTQNIQEYEAVRLFVDRAKEVKSDFAITDTNAVALAQICHRLDGIPLAIELAAAWVRSLSVEGINERLDNRFRLLTGGDRTALPRQQTLLATMDWSYHLLNPQEQLMFLRLSVFAGGWVLEAATRIVAEETNTDWEMLDVLTSLADKSLVFAEQNNGTTRYGMLETVREYASEKLQASGESSMLKAKHCEYFLAVSHSVERELSGPQQKLSMDSLEAEHNNFRAALDWSAQEVMGAETGLLLAGNLWWFWLVRGYLEEGRKYLTDTLRRHAIHPRTLARAAALNGAGSLALNQSDYKEATRMFEESIAIYSALEDQSGIATLHSRLGDLANTCGERVQAVKCYERALSIFRKLGDKYRIVSVLVNLARCGEFDDDYESAVSTYQEARKIYNELGDVRQEALTLGNLGNVAHSRHDYTAALQYYRDSIVMLVELDDRLEASHSIELLAGVLVLQSHVQRAINLFAATQCLRERVGVSIPPDNVKWYQQRIAQARAALGEAAFTTAWEEGRKMTWEQAVEYALGEK